GSFVSLWLSKWMAKRAFGVEIVSPSGPYGEVVRKVHEFAQRSGIEKMPEVGVYQSPEINAFATGATKNSSMVAVSTGLLERLSTDEAEGVLGHEVAHIANGDMVTLALVQGVVNAFVMFFARIATMAIDNIMRGDDDNGRGLGFFAYMIIYNLLYFVFSLLAAPIVFGFSRFREYRADNGGARLAGKHKMIAALEALQRNYDTLDKFDDGIQRDNSVRAMQISSKVKWSEFFSTHPTIEKRLENLKRLSA
ncbi:MAG: protease HtpX, partial [Bacteriovoracaceae bacterium]|nr:protease HtpX [Bacteriovoracaceae bacterium]